MDAVSTGRRIKAARQLIPLTVPQLAKRLNLPGLGAKTLGNIERGARDLRAHEVAPLAQALGVPETFLTDENPTGTDPVTDRMAAMEARLMEQAGLIRQLLDQQNQNLERQSEILERIEQAVATETAAAETMKTAAETAGKLVQRIDADVRSGRLPVRPRASKAAASKTAAKRTPRA